MRKSEKEYGATYTATTTPCQKYDQQAVELSHKYLACEAELLSHLITMRKKRYFVSLNYAGIFDYCERRLHLSRAQAYYFKSVAEKSDEVPEIKQAVMTGELTLSQARRIVPVINKTNHRQWIQKAKELPQRELEREVTALNPQAHIREKLKWVAKELSELRVSLGPRAAANLTALQNILSQKRQKAASMGDVVAWSLEVARGKFDPIARAKRSVGRKPETGKKNCAQRPQRHANMAALSSLDPGFCPGRQSTSRRLAPRVPIPAAVKHAVVLRDQLRCTFVAADGTRCRQQRWIHVHHIKEWSRGGRNEIGNLRLLCRTHHALEHSRPDPQTIAAAEREGVPRGRVD
ncbi:MAG: HNH endonuclease [Bdellovibrionales bacterium]|nr:HNH endonuclease [Bdellovibrionales bacterium]